MRIKYLHRLINEADIKISKQSKLIQSQAVELELSRPHIERFSKLQVQLNAADSQLKFEIVSRTITQGQNEPLQKQHAQQKHALEKENTRGDLLSPSLERLQNEISKSEKQFQEKLAAYQRRVADLEAQLHFSKKDMLAKETSYKLQEQEKRINILHRQINEADVKILKQAKLIQSQAVELEQCRPPSELLRKFQVQLSEVNLQLKIERVSRTIAERNNESLYQQHARAQRALEAEKSRGDQLSQSLESLHHQMESSKKHYHETLTATQRRVDDFEAQLLSAKKVLSASKASLNLIHNKK
uniref:Uncharacterized protein n=1 Tax=Eptatretus burgeri TaxID=7764 RepID=A0A8C4QDR2_EPTBU